MAGSAHGAGFQQAAAQTNWKAIAKGGNGRGLAADKSSMGDG